MKEKNNSAKKCVCLIIETLDGWVLQKRENKDGIWTPGKTSHWGGVFEPEDDDNPRAAALRELKEETTLEEESVTIDQFLVEEYSTTTINAEQATFTCYCYLVKILDSSHIFVHEGDGSVLISFDENLDDPALNLSPFTRHLLFVLRSKRYEDPA